MRRLLVSAKYLPLALSVALLVAWLLSLFAWFGIDCLDGSGHGLMISHSKFELWILVPKKGATWDMDPVNSRWISQRQLPGVKELLSQFDWYHSLDFYPDEGGYWHFDCPIPAIVALLLPLAVGPLLRYRFPLWAWFAWTAMIGCLLAYYLAHPGPHLTGYHYASWAST